MVFGVARETSRRSQHESRQHVTATLGDESVRGQMEQTMRRQRCAHRGLGRGSTHERVNLRVCEHGPDRFGFATRAW
jgi:hypothetical protein